MFEDDVLSCIVPDVQMCSRCVPVHPDVIVSYQHCYILCTLLLLCGRCDYYFLCDFVHLPSVKIRFGDKIVAKIMWPPLLALFDICVSSYVCVDTLCLIYYAKQSGTQF